MSMPERTKIQIWETADNPIPVPEETVLLDKEAPALTALFARAVVDGAKGIDIYPATYDGYAGCTFFAWTDGDGERKGQLLHSDKDYVIRVAERFLEKLTSRYERMHAAQG